MLCRLPSLHLTKFNEPFSAFPANCSLVCMQWMMSLTAFDTPLSFPCFGLGAFCFCLHQWPSVPHQLACLLVWIFIFADCHYPPKINNQITGHPLQSFKLAAQFGAVALKWMLLLLFVLYSTLFVNLSLSWSHLLVCSQYFLLSSIHSKWNGIVHSGNFLLDSWLASMLA